MSQPSGLGSKRWAQRATAAPFGELAAVRATAGQWRNGLAGLTALLSAGSLLASPTLADHLGGGARLVVGALTILGLLTLLFATWRAMDAAFGLPGAGDYLTGERLQAWEHEQASRAVTALATARWAFLLGLLLIIAAAATAFWVPPVTGTLTRVKTVTGIFCGQLDSSGGHTVAIIGTDGTVHTIPVVQIRSFQQPANC